MNLKPTFLAHARQVPANDNAASALASASLARVMLDSQATKRQRARKDRWSGVIFNEKKS